VNLRKDHYRITPNISMFEVDMWIDWSRGEKKPTTLEGKKIVWGKKLPSQRLASPSSFFLSLWERGNGSREKCFRLCAWFFFLLFLSSFLGCVSAFPPLLFPPLLLGRGEKKGGGWKRAFECVCQTFLPQRRIFSNKKNIFLRECEKQLATVDL